MTLCLNSAQTELTAASDRQRLVWVTGKRIPASNPRSYSRPGWGRSGELAGQGSGPMKSGVSRRRNSIASRALCATLSFYKGEWRHYLGEVGKFNLSVWLIYPRHCTPISIKIGQHLLKLCTKVFWCVFMPHNCSVYRVAQKSKLYTLLDISTN